MHSAEDLPARSPERVDEIFTDVFNKETLEYVSSLYFPKVPRVISNTKAYYIDRVDEDSFYTVGIFSIIIGSEIPINAVNAAPVSW